MPHLRWTARPALRRPFVVAAFEGWNDAGDAASTTVQWLCDRYDLRPFADIDPEEFFDFTSTRPEARLVDGRRQIEWPATQVFAGAIEGRDAIVVQGTEPQLRWRTYCDALLETFQAYDVELVVTLGALLAEVPHTRPTSVMATSEDEALGQRLHLERSSYEGPTGIVGVLHQRCVEGGIPTMSLWAAVSAYVPGAPSPKATLAIVERLGAMLDLGFVTTDLEIASAAYERQVSEVVADDEEMIEYLARLERSYDEDAIPSPTSLIRELEQFLKDQQ
jgi:predicted ATP-grasp superfamily ATP-dependent carboligase